MATHWPCEQSGGFVHAVPQPPQFCGSVPVSTQTPPQSVPPFGHSHVPLPQSWPPVQTTPHEPQLLESPFGFTQAPPHRIWLWGQVVPFTQAPIWQLSPVAHVVPQAPQFWKLESRSTHMPLQSVRPTSQVHLPVTQICPAEHALSHAPQFAGSLPVSTQPPPHFVRVPQSPAQTPSGEPDSS